MATFRQWQHWRWSKSASKETPAESAIKKISEGQTPKKEK